MSNGGCDQKLKSKHCRRKISNTPPLIIYSGLSLSRIPSSMCEEDYSIPKTMSNRGCDQKLDHLLDLTY
eukprot:scaffold24456_cov51-Attheya_sp.AAC.4